MLDLIQWTGSLLICGGFYFMVTQPRVSAAVTIIGCAALVLWAFLLTPIAYGIVTLQSVVILLSMRNLSKSGVF